MNVLHAASIVLATAVVAGPANADDNRDSSPLAILRETASVAQQVPRPARDVILTEIAIDMAEAGHLDDASRTADSIEHSGSKDRALSAISIARAKTGDIPGALRSAQAIGGESEKGQVIAVIARTQVQAGDVEGAIRTAESFGPLDSSWPRQALIAIVEALARSGNIQKATSLAQSRLAGPQRSAALRLIAGVQRARGDADAALRTLESTDGPTKNADVLQLKVQFLIEAGLVQEARRVAESGQWRVAADPPFTSAIPPSMVVASLRDDALAKVVAAQAQAGDLPALFDTADAIASRYERCRALAEAGVTRNEAGDQAAARSILAKALSIAEDGGQHPSELKDIAYAQARIEGLAAARETFRRAVDPNSAVLNQTLVTQRQLAAGDAEGALRTAEAITPAWGRALAVAQIAEGQARSGDRQGATASFGKAVQDASKAPCETLREIARTQVRSGDVRGALAWIDAESVPHRKAYALLGVAEGALR